MLLSVIMSRPLSARHRKAVGRCNAADFDVPQSQKTRPKSANISVMKNSVFGKSPGVAEKYDSLNIAQKPGIYSELKDTFVPTMYVEKEYKLKPVLPPSRHPTCPPPKQQSPGRYRRPLICPQSWLDADKEPPLTTTLDFAAMQNSKLKMKLAREFIQTNRHRMGVFDQKNSKMTPHQICDDMVNTENFANMLLDFKLKERGFNIGSSAQVKSTFADDGYNSLGEIKNDPFLASLKTSRGQRESRLHTMLAASTESNLDFVNNNPRELTRFRRGYRHAPEYGNFSAFNGLLIANDCKLH